MLVGADPDRLITLAARCDDAARILDAAHGAIASTLAGVGALSCLVDELGRVTEWTAAQPVLLRRRARLLTIDVPTAGSVRLFANSRDAEAAGREAADWLLAHSGDADELFALWHELRTSWADPDFLGAFFARLGPELTGVLPHLLSEQAHAYGGDVVTDLLAPLSLALATASRRNRLPAGFAAALVEQTDAAALGALLWHGRFSDELLLHAGRHVVIDRLAGYEVNVLRGLHTPGRPVDPKAAVLEAIARSPHASALFLIEADHARLLLSRPVPDFDVDQATGAVIVAATLFPSGSPRSTSAAREAVRAVIAGVADSGRVHPATGPYVLDLTVGHIGLIGNSLEPYSTRTPLLSPEQLRAHLEAIWRIEDAPSQMMAAAHAYGAEELAAVDDGRYRGAARRFGHLMGSLVSVHEDVTVTDARARDEGRRAMLTGMDEALGLALSVAGITKAVDVGTKPLRRVTVSALGSDYEDQAWDSLDEYFWDVRRSLVPVVVTAVHANGDLHPDFAPPPGVLTPDGALRADAVGLPVFNDWLDGAADRDIAAEVLDITTLHLLAANSRTPPGG